MSRLTIIDPAAGRLLPPVHRAITLDDVRLEIGARCDRLVSRQRGGYSAARARAIVALRSAYDALATLTSTDAGRGAEP